MAPSQDSVTYEEAYEEWKKTVGRNWNHFIACIKEACECADHQRVLDIDPFPTFKARRNILHSVIFESDDVFESIQEKFRLPLVRALVETALDEKSRRDFVNTPDANGVRPLQMAAMEGHTLIARYLIEQGAQVNSRDDDDVTPLHWAAENLRPDMVQLLLEHLQEEDRMPYDAEFSTPEDLLARRVEERFLSDDTAARDAAQEIRMRLGGGDAPGAQGSRQRSTPSNTFRSQIVALRGTEDKSPDARSLVFNKSVSEVLYGSPPVLQRMRDGLLDEDKTEPPKRWRSYGVFLPQINLDWIKVAARIIFKRKGDRACKAVLDFIERFKSRTPYNPGFYPVTPLVIPKEPKPTYDEQLRTNRINDLLEDVYCIVLPILDVKDRTHLPRRVCLQTQVTQHTSTQPNQFRAADENMASNEQMLFTEQSLDEYCHKFLTDEQLYQRDKDQVVSRYSTNNGLRTEEIVVVSQLWIWKFGDFLISTYGNDLDSSSSNDQCEKLSRKIFTGSSSFPNTNIDDMTMGALQAIMEECVRYEPRFPQNERRELLEGAGAFASEIARQSDFVTRAFDEYKKNLGQVDRHYEMSVEVETDCLLRLDDVLGELAMIRRVHEDLRLLCMNQLNNKSDLDRWAERSESKLRRLEDDASRVRESLVTLLGLKQREVNTESLINSRLQSQILVVFTAATVLFTPLSWISSLMALNIRNFSPQDSIWSLSAAATASVVSLVGFVALMALALRIWWWVDKKVHTRKDKNPQGLTVNASVPAQGEHDYVC